MPLKTEGLPSNFYLEAADYLPNKTIGASVKQYIYISYTRVFFGNVVYPYLSPTMGHFQMLTNAKINANAYL